MIMRSSRLILSALLVITACRGVETSNTAGQTPAAVDVHATGFLFKPDLLEVQAGATVTWTNDDDILHTVTSGEPESPDDQFDRDLDGKGSTTSIVFDEPGEYQYFCSRHPHMTGVVTVEEQGS
jgi:plastocyanin